MKRKVKLTTQPQPRGERARVDKCPTCSCTLEHGRGYRYYGKGNGEMACDDKWHAESTFNDPAPPRGEGDDLATRLDGDRLQEWFTEIQASASLLPEDLQIIEAMIARASTHPEQWVSGDDREWLLWITSYVLNRHEFTDSAATDARAALTRIATAIKQPASPTPTEQGEDRTRVEWHDGIEHGDELALRQLAADIGCGIPYGCQPSVGKWYAAALDRVLDRLLPLDPAPEQGEARVEEDVYEKAARRIVASGTTDQPAPGGEGEAS